MRKAKIVCTIGPASSSEDLLKKLVLAGMDVARLNFSHGSHEEHAQRLEHVRAAEREIGRPRWNQCSAGTSPLAMAT